MTGNMAATSAKGRAATRIMRPPTIQATIDAGPASWAAKSGPNNQPEPMMPPTATKVRPTAPTARRGDSSTSAGLRSPATFSGLLGPRPPGPA